MVWKTTAGTDKFATTRVLSMPKPLTFETTQGIWDERFNWYIKVTSFDGWRKDGYVAGGFRVFKNDTKLLGLFHSGFLLRSWRLLFL